MNTETAKIRLRNDARRTLQGAAAAALTCYGESLSRGEEIPRAKAAAMLPGLWEAGHHTVFQHQHLEFEIEGISRHAVRGFLHNFPFYNTEQQSQRYTKPARPRKARQPFHTPGNLPQELEQEFNECALQAFEDCKELTEILTPQGATQGTKSGKILRRESKAARRRAMEEARYLLPGGARSNLVYTIPVLVLAALHKTARQSECPEESTEIAEKMKKAFLEQVPEGKFLFSGKPSTPSTALPALTALPKAPSIPSGKRVILTRLQWMDPEDLPAALLDPDLHPELLSEIDLSHYTDAGRQLSKVRIAYARRISLSADLQNQRHRTLRAFRPALHRAVPLEFTKDSIETPSLVRNSKEGLRLYRESARRSFEARRRIHEAGFPKEAAYLLPNCTSLRYEEEGPLPGWVHRWTLRTCLNAQEEIRESAMEELAELRRRAPDTAARIGPPCVLRNKRLRPRCPEGPRFCGIPVWNLWDQMTHEP